jgi:hypothetical protein
MVTIYCTCESRGVLVPCVVDRFDIGPDLGLESLVVRNCPVLKCDQCGETGISGAVVESVGLELAIGIIGREPTDRIEPGELDFLRSVMMESQQALADALCVNRMTVNRWETGKVALDGVVALGVRSHALSRLLSRYPGQADAILAAVEPYLLRSPPTQIQKKPKMIDAQRLAAAM